MLNLMFALYRMEDRLQPWYLRVMCAKRKLGNIAYEAGEIS
jgi:hypothetical protein